MPRLGILQLSPPMALEAPREYVTFVERHLSRLRRDAALVVGEGHHADELYPEVLADVAVRWGRLELLRKRLRRPGAADAYLRRAFARHARRWQEEQLTPVEVEVWRIEDLPGTDGDDGGTAVAGMPGTDPTGTGANTAGIAGAGGHRTPPGPPALVLTVEGWQPERLAPVHTGIGLPEPLPPLWTSLALRLAPVLLADSRIEVRPLAEAAIAWWHAYEARRRRRYVVAVTVLLLLLGFLSRLSQSSLLYT